MADLLKVTVEPSIEDHAFALAPNLRQSDIQEASASHGFTPHQALIESLYASKIADTLLFNDVPVAMCGAAPYQEDTGIAWLLGSAAINRHPVAFIRFCKAELPKLLAEYSCLVNFVDARYTRALKWVEYLGFEVGQMQPYGTKQFPFYPIRIRRSTCASLIS